MNIAIMLSQAAAAASVPKDEKPPHPRMQNLLLGGPSQAVKAFARYKAVMQDNGWMTKGQIEAAMGLVPSASAKYLRKLLSEGHVQRRNRGNAKRYVRRLGHEWRWKEGKSDKPD